MKSKLISYKYESPSLRERSPKQSISPLLVERGWGRGLDCFATLAMTKILNNTIMMKYIIVAAALLIFIPTTQAQLQYDSEFTVSLGAGSSALKYQIEQEKSKPGFGWELGAGYTRYFSGTIGVSLGLEAAMFSSSIEMKTIPYSQQITPPPGLQGQFLLKANYSGFNEKQTALMLQVPIMLQFRFPVNEKNIIYLGAGIKAGFPVSSKWNQSIDKLTTTGYSDYTLQDYIDMPNHGFSTYSNLKSSGKLELKSPVFFALEGGLKFAIGEGKFLYTGVFLDYGINDIYNASTNSAMLEYNNVSPADYNFNSILVANQYSVTEGIKPFAVGIKIKMGIGMGDAKSYNKVKKEKPVKEDKPVKKVVIPKEQKTESIGN